MTDIKSKATSALFWSFFQKIGTQGIQFIISIILARLLLPEQFGLIAMLWIFISIGQSLIDSGFGTALVQKKDATYIDECSMFYFNIVVGFIASGLMWLSAPIIAHFYKQTLLLSLTRVMSIALIINSFGLVHSILLNKQINFKTQLKVSILASIISGTIGVILAFNGFGVWSLVAQSLSSNLFVVIFLWHFNTWRPSLIFSFNSLRGMFPFGSRMLLSGLINTLFQNLYTVVIGKLFSPAILGFYSRAIKLQELPLTVITRTVGSVTFPVFSVLHGEGDKLRFIRAFRKASSLLVMICFPMMVGLMIVAKPLVLVLFTNKWEPCIPYLQLLCLAGILQPLQEVNLNVLLAHGRSDLYFRLEILKKIIIIIAIAVTFRWGISAMICGQIVTAFLSYIINSYYAGKMLDYSISKQTKDLLPSLLLSGIMGGGIYVCYYIPLVSQLALLVVQILTGIILYTLLCYIFKIPYFMEFVQSIKSKIYQLIL